MIKAMKCSALLAVLLLCWIWIGCQSTAPMKKPSRTPDSPQKTERPRTIAVWDLENLNPAELKEFNLGELLAGKVLEAFETSNQWTVVEREQLLLALEEQNLGTTAVVSDDTRLQIGKIVGANAMVFGSYMKFMQTLQLNLRIVDVETGQIIRATKKAAPFKNVGDALDMTDKAVSELLQ